MRSEWIRRTILARYLTSNGRCPRLCSTAPTVVLQSRIATSADSWLPVDKRARLKRSRIQASLRDHLSWGHVFWKYEQLPHEAGCGPGRDPRYGGNNIEDPLEFGVVVDQLRRRSHEVFDAPRDRGDTFSHIVLNDRCRFRAGGRCVLTIEFGRSTLHEGLHTVRYFAELADDERWRCPWHKRHPLGELEEDACVDAVGLCAPEKGLCKPSHGQGVPNHDGHSAVVEGEGQREAVGASSFQKNPARMPPGTNEDKKRPDTRISIWKLMKTDPLGDLYGGGRSVTQQASMQDMSTLVHAPPASWRPACV
jgi:hypothetical protein